MTTKPDRTARSTALPTPSVWKMVSSTAGARVLVMGVGGVFALMTSRLIIGHFGVHAYSQFGLLTQLRMFLPFADLGLAAVLLNTIAACRTPRTDPVVRRTLTTVFRVLLVSSVLIIAGTALITARGWWYILLGDGLQSGGGVAAFLCFLVFALALPLSVGSRVLIAIHEGHKQTLLQVVVAPTLFAMVAATVLFRLPMGNLVAVFAYAASGVGAVACYLLGARMLRPQFREAFRDVIKVRSVRNVQFIGTAWPQLVSMLVIPIAMYSDRLLLSHFGTASELAEYTLASQIFGMATQAIVAGGAVLWPFYARARADGTIRSPFKPMFGFVAGGLMMTVSLAVITPWLSGLVGGGQIYVSKLLVIGFIVFATTEAAKYPLGMYLTDPHGLRMQVPFVFVMVPANVLLSWWLISVIGASGPIIGSALSVLVCQVCPYAWLVRRDVRKRRLEIAGGISSGAGSDLLK